MPTQKLLLAAVALVASAVAGLHAQTSLRLDHPLTSSAGTMERSIAATSVTEPETLRVLAVMIDFQPDNDTRTSGNGRFDLSAPTKRTIDQAPHDQRYFRNHLTFLQNYFRRCSDGKLIVAGTLLDSVYHLPNPMRQYSPPRNSSVNLELGNLMRDAWHTVDSLTPGFPFASYDAFLIFHAGAGRDIDLVSLYGFDPTPFDLPSLYLNLQGLRRMYGSTFAGVPVAGESFLITNSLIIPETEAREVATIGGTARLALGINGLLAASIGSHLGLPDLFDTKTGRTAIGRFGLMDGQSIFSWNGVFPPEPSAWEKFRLGWIQPITISADTGTYTFPAVSLRGTVDSIYRVPISAREYFLLENRNRDANGDSAHITMMIGDQEYQRVFARDTTGFNAFRQDSLFGVITDVDEFDFSLPGGVNTSTNEWFNGGMLIWHIDENVIDANLATGTVNAYPDRRGVDLEEADGSQDIGQTYGFLSSGSGSEDGTALDFWYKGNIAPLRVRSNEFSPSSHPNSLSNDGANSHVTINRFSARVPYMTARIQFGDDQVKTLAGFPKPLGSSPGTASVLLSDLDGDGLDEILLATSGKASLNDTTLVTDGRVLAWRQDGAPFFPPAADSIATFIASPGESFDQPVALDFDGDGHNDIAVFRHPSAYGYTNGTATVYNSLDVNHDLRSDVLFQYVVASSGMLLPYVATAGPSSIYWGGNINLFLRIGADTATPGGSYQVSGAAALGSSGGFVDIGYQTYLQTIDSLDVSRSVNLERALVGSPVVADVDLDNNSEIVVASADGKIYLLDTSLAIRPNFPVSLTAPIMTSPVVADLNGDGRKDLIVTAGNSLYAINYAGSFLDHFPVVLPTSKPVLSSPVVGDIDGDGLPDIMLGTQEGLLVAYTARGQMIQGFPLQVGGAITGSPALFRTAGGNVGVAVASEDRRLYAWKLGAAYDSTHMPWRMYLHDSRHGGYEGSSGVSRPVSSDYFPASRVYNWPNPVGAGDGFKTHIRYFLGSDSNVHIRIFDLAGELVTELTAPGTGGIDNEIEWDVSNIQSGIYLARVEADGGGKSGFAIVKIAVVK